MTDDEAHDIVAPVLTRANLRALSAAVDSLENPNFVARIADYAGAPVHRALAMLPRPASVGLSKAVELAIRKGLDIAIDSLDKRSNPSSPRWPPAITVGFTGGISGLLGLAALPVELPVTTTLMLRAIAEIARQNGEDLDRLEARLACLQVFALGARREGARTDIGYYAARTLLTRFTGNAAAYLLERGAAGVSGPMINGFVAEIVSRFGIVVSDRAAASALPVVGAIGGATLNVIFMNHFEQIARGHFTVRRLERQYGAEIIGDKYAALVAQRAAGRS